MRTQPASSKTGRGRAFALHEAPDQFEIIGEVLNQLSKVDPAAASRVPELGRIVAFRNILIMATHPWMMP